MKLSPRQRKELESAAITYTLALIAVCSAVFALSAFAADPSWWSSPGTGLRPAVMQMEVVTNSGRVSTNYITDDNAMATQGQLKQFTARAVDELNVKLTNGAGANLNAIVSSWATGYTTHGYNATNLNPTEYTVINVGQLKYVGGLVYGQLANAGYVGLYPTWLNTISSDNLEANLGQLKQVFNFDVSLAGPINLASTGNTNGTVNLSWNWPSTNQATSYYLEQQDVDGSWRLIAALTNTAMTTYAVTNLNPGQNPAFQIIAQNGARASVAHTTPEDPGLLPPSNVHCHAGIAPGEVDLTWQNNATDATYIRVRASADGKNWNIIAVLNNPTTTSCTLTNMTVGQSYYFGVSAGNN